MSTEAKPKRGPSKGKVLLFEGRGIKVYVAARTQREAADQILSGFTVRECTADEVWRAGRAGIVVEEAKPRTRKPNGQKAGAEGA